MGNLVSDKTRSTSNARGAAYSGVEDWFVWSYIAYSKNSSELGGARFLRTTWRTLTVEAVGSAALLGVVG